MVGLSFGPGSALASLLAAPDDVGRDIEHGHINMLDVCGYAKAFQLESTPVRVMRSALSAVALMAIALASCGSADPSIRPIPVVAAYAPCTV